MIARAEISLVADVLVVVTRVPIHTGIIAFSGVTSGVDWGDVGVGKYVQPGVLQDTAELRN